MSSSVSGLLKGLVIVVVGAGLGTGAYWLTKDSDQLGQKTTPPLVTKTITEPPPVTLLETDKILADLTESQKTSIQGFERPLLLDRDQLEVTWRQPVRVKVKDAFADALPTEPEAITVPSFTGLGEESRPIDLTASLLNAPLWETGTVKGGTYDGFKTYILALSCAETLQEMGCTDPEPRRLLIGQTKGKTQVIFLINPTGKNGHQYGFEATEPYSTYETAIYANPVEKKYFTPALFLTIKDLTLAPTKTLTTMTGKKLSWTLATPTQLMTKDNGVVRSPWLWDLTGETFKPFVSENIIKTQEGWLVHQSENQNCLFVFGPDGATYTYTSLAPFTGYETGGLPGYRLDIKWKIKEYQTEASYYPWASSGCGGHNCAKILTAEQVGPMSGLIAAGTTSDNEPVYIPKNPVKNTEVKLAYDSWVGLEDGSKTKPSINIFVKKHPAAVFFWKDAFGRWVRYHSANIMPAIECGKPVIYLYPERTSRVNVSLPNFVKVTKSEPIYLNGWTVTAEPDGQLTTSDGKVWNSLYWDGTGVNYSPAKEGFVVKDGDVKVFFERVLPQYGLNQQETSDFIAFWLPHLTSAPYYRVSFLTSDWSRAAPLNVSPRPTTSIRIFMDWNKLAAPIKLQEPKIITPIRRGFTLVEWGGLILGR